MSFKFLKYLKFFVVFSSISVFSQTQIATIPIPSADKNLTNLSGKVNDSISFHLIINKESASKKYKSTIYLATLDGVYSSLDISLTDDKPNYLTFHVNENILTFIRGIETGTVIEDYDFLKNTISTKTISARPKRVFSTDNRTYLFKLLKNGYLDYCDIKSSEDLKRKLVKFSSKEEEKLLSRLLSDKLEFINTDEYITKGPIRDFKAYSSPNGLIITKIIKKDYQIVVYHLTNEGKIKARTVPIQSRGKLKKVNSFIRDNILFVFAMTSDFSDLNIYDLSKDNIELVKNHKYDITKFGPKNEVVVNGRKATESFTSKRFLRSFFPQAVGSTYNAELYVGVNKSTEGHYIVEIGHLDKNRYKNSHGINYWWNYPAFSINYNLTSGNLSGSFSAAVASMLIFEAFAAEKRKGNYFRVNLDKEFSHMTESLVEDSFVLDTESYDFRLKNLFKLKNRFYIPFEDHVRAINFDRDNSQYNLYVLTKR